MVNKMIKIIVGCILGAFVCGSVVMLIGDGISKYDDPNDREADDYD